MDYRQYLRICEAFGYTDGARPQLARSAALAASRAATPHTLPNLRQVDVFKSHPELLRVPVRRLNRWARRAMVETIPRSERWTGPLRAMASRGIRW